MDNSEAVLLGEAATCIQRFTRGYLCRMPVISVVKSDTKIIDLQRLKSLIEKYFDGIIGDMIREEGSNLKIDSNISEYLVEKCIKNGRRVGKGNGPMDVENEHMSIDVTSLCLNGDITNEKSIIQNFKKSGNLLDTHFQNGEHEKCVNLFLDDMEKKMEYGEKDKYYLAFISSKSDIHLCILKINLSKLLFVKSDGFSSQRKSIKTRGFIAKNHGSVTLYKSKKRFELRLNKRVLKHAHHLFTLC